MNRSTLNLLLAVGVSFASITTGSTANAAVIVNLDGSVTFDNTGGANTVLVNFTGIGGKPKVLVPGLSATLTLTLNSIAANVFSFNYSMLNTSTVAGTGVSGFGFNVGPNATAVSATGFYDKSGLNANFASLPAEVCINGGPGTCPQAGGPEQLQPFQVGAGTFNLTMTGSPTAITLSNFLDRYQGFSTTNIQDKRVTSAVGQGFVLPSVQAPVPEPATWLMMIFGFGLAGAFMRQGRRGFIRPRRSVTA